MSGHQTAVLASNRVLPWVVYPATMGACVFLHLALAGNGVAPVVAAYAAVLLGAVTIVVFERVMPERREWMADRESVLNDLLFLLVVQMLLPKFLSFLVAVLLVRGLPALGWSPENLWVHGWPVWVQAILMILIADFLRYWLHVASHRVPLLWRLHAVHHSPKKLYWLNVGRFHPLEKGIQFLCDALPFILVGVGEEVLALYFVFYAVNGFFQHCNIRLRFGWLNYLISSAELHRWHHSKTIAESDRNYGNNVIVWDLLFGTWFLPAERKVGELGLRNEAYPLGFEAQIRAPFVPRLDHVKGPMLSWRDVMLNLCSRVSMVWVRWRHFEPMRRSARKPGEVQKKVLARILGAHAGTGFGREHGLFAEMGLEAFRRQVPLSDYERIRPYIERQDATGELALNPVAPAIYNVTSGTSGAPKYLPVLPETVRALARDQLLVTYLQTRVCPEGFEGKTLGIVSAAVEGQLPSGAPFGSASGQIYREMPRLARAKYVLPPEVFELEDYGARYYVILRLALAERDITYMGSANPTTFLRLLELVEEHRVLLLRDIEEGTCQFLEGASERQREVILRRCASRGARAAELRKVMGEAVDFAVLWPFVRVVTTWTGGSCGVALESLRSKLPAGTTIIDLGFLSSELRVTITVDVKSGAGVPTFCENFFEFVERGAWEREEAEFLTLDEIEVGQAYYLFVTTPSGLFRYPMNDIVEVVGRFEATPTLKFLQKGMGVTNVTGEKLYEFQVLEAMRRAEVRLGFRSRFVQFLADDVERGYVVYLEVDPGGSPDAVAVAVAGIVDEELVGLNLEYEAKRKSGRLEGLKVFLLNAGAYSAYRAERLGKGGREAQFKTVALRYRRDFEFDFEAYLD